MSDYRKFNDDILSAAEDRELAARKYPTILHVLDHPELRELFDRYDEPAKRAKRNGLTFGLLAIGLAFTALVIAAFEHLFNRSEAPAALFLDRLREWPTILALVAAVCGVAGILIGGIGVLYAERKRRWLHQRLMTERLRQFHFQTFVCRVPEILKSLKNEQAQRAYLQSRSLWLDEVTAKFSGKLDAKFATMLDEQGEADFWLHDAKHEPAGVHDNKELDPLFAAYRELRIARQIGYANYRLKNDNKIFSADPRGQAAALWNIGFISILALAAIHMIVLSVVLIAPLEWSNFSSATSTAAILIALIALAARAIEQGLHPEREVERYQQYRAALRAVQERFDAAPSQAEKLAVMREMERISFDEMRNFLITNDRSRFVM